MKNKATALAGAIALATVAQPALAADIVHLQCEMPGDGEPFVWKIALDEGAKTISFENPHVSGMKPAIFTSDKVLWNDGRLEISRTDLVMTRRFLGQQQQGQCKIVTPAKRAF